MLRIDENAKTLVAPEASAYEPADTPGRDELHALICGGFEAFAAEIGQPQLKAAGASPEPGIDILAVDEPAGRAVVIVVTDGSADDALGRALHAAAVVSGWDAERLGGLHQGLQDATPGDSPRIIIVGAHFDEASLRTYGWLVGRHGVEIIAYGVEVMRRGDEKLMEIVPTYPARGDVTAPEFIAQVDASHSAPPPGIPAPPQSAPAAA